jgi:hypothetical protein
LFRVVQSQRRAQLPCTPVKERDLERDCGEAQAVKRENSATFCNGVVKAIERPAAFKNKGRNIAKSRFWNGFHAAVFRCFPRPRKKLPRNNCLT